MALTRGKIFTITSVKGGTGKSTTILNLAGIFHELKKKTLIIDLDLYAGAIAASLNLDNSNDIYKLADDITNNRFDGFDSYIFKYNEYIDVLPSCKDPRNANRINAKVISTIFNKLRYIYDVILVDTNYFMGPVNLVAFDNSDKLLYVLTNNPIDLKSMRTMTSIYKDMEFTNYLILLNESREVQKEPFTYGDIKNIINRSIDFQIDKTFFIRNIDQYLLNGEILTLNKKIRVAHNKTIKTFHNLALALLKDDEEE